tara:strand:+ start:3246 stop:3566 length:321 start_codon:yes stop_codon:yes gene_type:complete
MPNKKKETDETETSAPEIATEEAGDTRPMRPSRAGGQLYPVIRTYFDPRRNAVIDVLEVTKTLPARLGQPAQQVKIERHTRCRDEALQEKYTQKRGAFDIPPTEAK